MKSMIVRSMVLLLASTSLGGCKSLLLSQLDGPEPVIDSAEAAQLSDNQSEFLQVFARDGGLQGLPTEAEDKNWKLVADGGLNYIDLRCSRYIETVFWVGRVKGTTIGSLGVAQSGAANILQATGSAAKELSIVAAAFGIITGFVNQSSDALLYKLDPSSVGSLYNGMKNSWRESYATSKRATINTRGGAVLAIQEYAQLCMPSRLEAEVNAAVKLANVGPADSNKPAEPKDGSGGAKPPVGPADGPGTKGPKDPTTKPEPEKGTGNPPSAPTVEVKPSK